MPDAAHALRVGVVGAGYFARFHIDAWLRNESARLVGVADLDRAKAREALRSCGAGDRQAVETLNMLGSDLDIIDIAAPPAAHFRLIEQALKTDARVIVCQKPFCSGFEEARVAARIAKEAGKALVIHENFRFQPWYRTVRNEVAKGVIGDLYQISFRLRPGDGQGADAYLARQPYFQNMERFLIHETGVHWIDTFRFLLGEPQSVFSDLRRLNPVIAGEDAGYFLFRYQNGRRALFDGNRLVDHATDNTRLTMGECLVEGSEGTISIDGHGAIRLRKRGEQDGKRIDCAFDAGRFGGDCVYFLQKHVTDHLMTGTPLENEASAYLRNIEIELALYDSADNGQVVEVGG